jgi:hypothetical protein
MKKEFEEELNEITPFLADLKKHQQREPFRTPRLYFDTLADKVIEQAKNETVVAKTPPPDYIGIYDKYKTHFSIKNRVNNWLSTILEPRMALSICTFILVLGAGWSIINKQKTTNGDRATSEIATNEEVHNYINEHIDEFKEEEILLAFAAPKTQKTAENDVDIKMVEPVLPQPDVQKQENSLKHPKSGLTEQELEEYLKEHLTDDDLETK